MTSDADGSVGGDFPCCKGESGSVAPSPVVQLREALADAERTVWHPHTAASLVAAARAALAWMSEEPDRIHAARAEAWKEGRNSPQLGPVPNPYRREGAPNRPNLDDVEMGPISGKGFKS